VRTLVETEVLVGEPGAYRLARALPAIQVPATVQAILAARIDRLPSEEKRLLQTAAVIGTEVAFTLLQGISAGAGREDAPGVFSGLSYGGAGAKIPFVLPIRKRRLCSGDSQTPLCKW
jgi:hypothetical protein